MPAYDPKTIENFGDEWDLLQQGAKEFGDRDKIFERYFHIVDWGSLPDAAVALDAGCGSGRWAALVAPRVGELHVVDASEKALDVARENLKSERGVVFHHDDLSHLSLPDGSVDFAYSLGVLHHVEDIHRALSELHRVLKPGAPLLVYIYYSLENRPAAYRVLWQVSDVARRVISKLPFVLRYPVSQMIAAAVYWPLARSAKGLERVGLLPGWWPLSFYRNLAFYTMRTDALDRFGTRYESRYTREQIKTLLEGAGFERIRFSATPPYWCAVGHKAKR